MFSSCSSALSLLLLSAFLLMTILDMLELEEASDLSIADFLIVVLAALLPP